MFDELAMIGIEIGQYECLRLLGRGGAGSVYFAVHRVLRTPRAIKVLLPQWTRTPKTVDRFIAEARAAASIRHRNIIGVHDCGRLSGDQWYILLDYCDGASLSRVLETHGGPLAPLDIVHILAEVANGLTAAHAQGILHRDLKPGNIHLTSRDGDPRHVTLLDFGVATLGEPAALTASGEALVGTPAYMAPEHLRGERLDESADVFSLAVIAYQMMSGAFPFQRGESAHEHLRLPAIELHRRITEQGATPLPARLRGDEVAMRSGLSPDRPLLRAWWELLDRALSSDRRRRPGTPRTFALQLAAALPHDGLAPDGLSVLRAYARELLEISERDETVRAPPAARPSGRAERYNLGRRIGAGGMAEVFAGTCRGVEGFERPIAIKRVLPSLSREPSFAAAFIEEARITSALHHPNLVSVFDFDRDADGLLFLVMELVEGADLAAVLRKGALPRPAAIYVVTEILRGLAYAHGAASPGDPRGRGGVIHRDLSPHNVLLSRDGLVKISDFGIARPLRGATSVEVSTLCGKPAYMSPEQVRMAPLDVRSDLFSVGLILWEALAGARPFDGTTKEILAQVRFKELPNCAPCSDLPADLDGVMRKLVARDPESRFSSAHEALDELLACRDAPRDGSRQLAALLRARLEVDRAAAPATEAAVGQTASDSARSAPRRSAGPPGVATPRRRSPGRAARSLLVVALCGGVSAAGAATCRREPRAPRAAPIQASASPPGAASPAATPRAAPAAGAVPGESSDSRTTSPAEHGTLVVAVRPWAEVWIDGKGHGETPVHARLPTGRHRVHLRNKRGTRTFVVVIAAARTTLLETDL